MLTDCFFVCAAKQCPAPKTPQRVYLFWMRHDLDFGCRSLQSLKTSSFVPLLIFFRSVELIYFALFPDASLCAGLRLPAPKKTFSCFPGLSVYRLLCVVPSFCSYCFSGIVSGRGILALLRVSCHLLPVQNLLIVSIDNAFGVFNYFVYIRI